MNKTLQRIATGLVRALPRMVTVAALCLTVAGPARAQDADFEANAKGMDLRDMVGRTMVGVTKSGSKVFSVYLGRDGTFKIHNSTGTKATGRFDRKDKVILCITGLDAKNPRAEVCKRAPQLGRGLDWMTILLETQNGKTTWRKENPDEDQGSSQMVYSFAGEVAVDQASYVTDVTQWAGHLIVGRTLKDREAWFAWLAADGSLDFVFGSGRRYKGRYTLKAGEICLTFPERPETDGCRKPTVKGGKILWASSKDGGATSEIVFMKPVDRDGPREMLALSSKDTRYIGRSPKGYLLLSWSEVAGELTMVDAATGLALGSFPGSAGLNDMEFSTDGAFFAVLDADRVDLRDSQTGGRLARFDRPKDAAPWKEVAVLGRDRIVIGDRAGGVSLWQAGTAAPLTRLAFATEPVTDVQPLADGRVVVAEGGGEVAVLTPDLIPVPGLSARFESPVTYLSPTPDGAYVLGNDRAGYAVALSLAPGAEKRATRRFVAKALWGLDAGVPGPSTNAVAVAGGEIIHLSVPALEVVARWEVGTPLTRAMRLAQTGHVAVVTKAGRFAFWGPDIATGKAFDKARRDKASGIRQAHGLRKDLVTRRLRAERDADEALIRSAAAAYDAGRCDEYDALAGRLHPADRKEDCAQAADKRQKRAAYDTALAEMRCDDAAALNANYQFGGDPVVRCRERAKREQDKRDFAAAKAAGDCETLRRMGRAMGEADAGVACDVATALASGSARRVYLLATQLDTEGDRARAKELYQTLMRQFPEDDLALTAAARLTALADMEALEKRQADLAAEQAAAIKAAEERARAAEKAARDAAREAERQREAREAEARRADQARRDAEAAAAAARPRRNTACDHVSPGQRFTIKGGGMFGLGDATYTVIGISREGGVLTGRLYGTDIQKQFSCYDVR